MVDEGRMKPLMKLIMIAVVMFIWPTMAMADQEDITMLLDPAFTTHQRPAVPFVHDMHNEKAGIEDCSVCHHVYKDGTLVEDESSEDESCSSCHPAKPKGKELGLMRAYHKRCITCHTETKKGPLSCGQCHVKIKK
jgi:hypothetical protein